MAYQPKSYRKFVATAATAAIVASAVAPAASAAGFTDVPARYQDAVDFVVSKGVNGLTATTFGTGEAIKRVDAAVMIAKVLELDTEKAPAAGFTDVPARAQGAVNALKAAGITSGKTATSFDANSPITRGELAIWIQRGFKLEGSADLDFSDVSDRYAEAVKALVANEITSGVSATKFGVAQEAKRGDYAIFLHKAHLAKEAPGVVEVSGVSAIDVNKVEVKFNSAIDTEKATIALKKGLATQYTTAKWAEDKKSVVLTSPSDIPAGDYTVVLSGVSEENITSDVTIEAEMVKEIAVNNTAVSKKDGAKVSFVVSNQYGTDMEVGANDTDLSVSAYNVTQGKTITPDLTSTKSEIALDLALDTDAKLDDKIRVIVSYKGVTVTKELTVVAADAVADIELANAELPKDATRFTVGNSDISLPYVLMDQYGKEIKLEANKSGNSISGVTFLSSDNSIVNPSSFATDNDGKLTFDLGSKAGNVTITAVINSTGDVSKTTLKVDEAGKVHAVAVSAPSKLVAAGESVSLDLNVTNQYGDTIKNDDAKVSALEFTSSDQAVVKDADINLVDGKLQVKTTGKGTATITVKRVNADTTKTEVGKVTLSVEAAAKATSITSVDVSSLYENTATDKVTFKDIKVKDQYGRDYSLTSGDAVTLVAKDSTWNDNVTTVVSGDGDYVLEDGEEITFTGTTTSTNEVITFKLDNGASLDLTLASVASKDITSYSIKEVPSIYADAGYSVDLELVGKTSAGKEVALTTGKVTHGTTSNSSVATISGKTVTGVAKGTATVALWNGATQLASTTVTVSEDAPVATKASIDDSVAFVADISDATKPDLGAKLEVLDQYGKDIAGTVSGFWYSSDENIATVDASGVVTGVAAGEVTISYVTSNGLTTSAKVKVQN